MCPRGDLLIRPAGPGDMSAIGEISSLTWEGHDYLHEVAPGWMEQSGFVVAELGGRVIGTGRITPMPGRVLWLEGLRVHPHFQGHGYGRRISDWLVDRGRSLVAGGEADAMEFSTYTGNSRSISISLQQGFSQIDGFYILYRECKASCLDGTLPVGSVRPSASDYSGYPGHIPCGWKPLLNVEESILLLEERCLFYCTPDGTRFHDSGDSTFSPAADVRAPAEQFFGGIDSVLASSGADACELVIHESGEDLVRSALDRGFGFWDETDGPNMLVFRMDQV